MLSGGSTQSKPCCLWNGILRRKRQSSFSSQRSGLFLSRFEQLHSFVCKILLLFRSYTRYCLARPLKNRKDDMCSDLGESSSLRDTWCRLIIQIGLNSRIQSSGSVVLQCQILTKSCLEADKAHFAVVWFETGATIWWGYLRCSERKQRIRSVLSLFLICCR